MAVLISMLRGVNVGGHNKIKMDALRALYESLKLRDPHTYVQSGNVIFRTEERDVLVLTKRVQNGIERKFGFRPNVIVRTCSELRDVIAKNPFANRRDIHPSKLLVIFLASDPGPRLGTGFSGSRPIRRNCGWTVASFKSIIPMAWHARNSRGRSLRRH